MDFESIQHPEGIGDTKFLATQLIKLQNSVDTMDEEELQKQGLKHVAYLKKVTCSQKMLSLQKNSSSYTVGEFVLLDDSQGFEDISACTSSLSSIRECLTRRSSLWSIMINNNSSNTKQPSGQQETNSTESSALKCDITPRSFVSLQDGKFSCCPPEVNFQIFTYLPQAQILLCRSVCRSWKTQIDFFFAFHSVLTSAKLRRYFVPKRAIPIPFEISHYDITEFTRHLKHQHFLDIPEPKSIWIMKKISSKNFLKLMACWRNIRHLTFFLEPLSSLGLFQKWSYYHPLEYFPKLQVLNIHLDRLHLARYKSFNFKQLRFNLDQILMNPYPHLHTFSFQMLNSGRHYACAFLAPILMFIGRQGKSLKKVEVSFHTGYKFESLPSYSADQHAPSSYVPLDDQIYVHGGFVNLLLLPLVKLTHCSLTLPAISGCTTSSGICNYFTQLLEAQTCLGVIHLEMQVGIELSLIERITNLNQHFLTDIEISLHLPLGKILDLNVFSKCTLLKSLRLKRVGFIDLPTQESQLTNFKQLPHTLQKLAFHRFYMSVMDLYLVSDDKPHLQCLCIGSCYIQATREEEFIVDGAMTKVLSHPELKFVCFSPIRRNTLNKIVFKLRTSDHFNVLLTCNAWHWSILSRELWLAKPRRLILHKGDEYCTKTWFKPYIFE